ncbi:MAG TPA: hypothetical protein VNB23_01185, partial [Ramlibacter sp.]|nr:hypothetical protein [Ramlibacter sp.]
MTRALFAPAHWVLAHLPPTLAVLVGCALVLAPAGVALYAADAMSPDALRLLVAALCALAVYGVLALRSFAAADIGRIVRITDRLASGELIDNVRAMQAGTSDAGRLWESVLRMNTTLAGIVRQVRTSADAVVAGSYTIAEGNAQLAQRTQEQAVSLEETASGIEHLASGARRNAES